MRDPVVWDEAAAAAGWQRWNDMCRREGMDPLDRDEPLLRAVFGASWYGTRFLFYGGADAAKQMCADVRTDPSDPAVLSRYLDESVAASPDEREVDQSVTGDRETERCMMKLRRGHSRALLALIGWDITGRLTQERLEYWLSCLACFSLKRTLGILAVAYPQLNELMVLAMGRLAGYEMNYGSDLDLIFLYKGRENVPPDLRAGIDALLTHCQLSTPAGRLYEVDTRLRPYGGAGALITSLAAFRDYHRQPRETWERQVLCRCRLLQDMDGSLAVVLEELAGVLYGGRDAGDRLARDIVGMRLRVEKELGRPAGRVDIKRGYGGMMDVDFLTHYLQLAHGRHVPGQDSPVPFPGSDSVAGLCFAGTRRVLRVATAVGLCDADVGTRLLNDYEFLKALEGRLRAFDMRSISRFPDDPVRLGAAARGLLWPDQAGAEASGHLLAHFRQLRQRVRETFLSFLGQG